MLGPGPAILKKDSRDGDVAFKCKEASPPLAPKYCSTYSCIPGKAQFREPKSLKPRAK